MTTYSDVAAAPRVAANALDDRVSDAVAVVVMCTCGWSDKIPRCEDVRAHAVKVRGAWIEHEREIAAERTTEA